MALRCDYCDSGALLETRHGSLCIGCIGALLQASKRIGVVVWRDSKGRRWWGVRIEEPQRA